MSHPVFILAAYKVVINAALGYRRGELSPFEIRLYFLKNMAKTEDEGGVCDLAPPPPSFEKIR